MLRDDLAAPGPALAASARAGTRHFRPGVPRNAGRGRSQAAAPRAAASRTRPTAAAPARAGRGAAGTAPVTRRMTTARHRFPGLPGQDLQGPAPPGKRPCLAGPRGWGTRPRRLCRTLWPQRSRRPRPGRRIPLRAAHGGGQPDDARANDDHAHEFTTFRGCARSHPTDLGGMPIGHGHRVKQPAR